MFRIGIVDLENEHLTAREQMAHGRPGVANRVRAGSPSSQSDGFTEHLGDVWGRNRVGIYKEQRLFARVSGIPKLRVNALFSTPV